MMKHTEQPARTHAHAHLPTYASPTNLYLVTSWPTHFPPTCYRRNRRNRGNKRTGKTRK